MARDFAARREARRLPRRQHLRARAGRGDRVAGTSGALVFVKEVAGPRELRRRRLRRRRTTSPTSSRRPASSTRATTRRRRATRSSASTATRRTCSRSSTRSTPSSRGELEITDVNRAYAQRGELDGAPRRGLVARRRQALGRPRRRRPADRGDGREQVSGHSASRSRRHEDERGWFQRADARERAAEAGSPGQPLALAAGRDPRRCTTTSAARTTSSSASQGMVRVVVLDRETGETFTEDIGDDNPVAIYVPGATRTATRR